jgi:hypothetical protein
MQRDCKAAGCVVTALANYTSQLLPPRSGGIPAWERAQAAKFVVHFVGDLHQPLHTEDVARGGNGIHVKFDGVELNLHHVWDSSIAEKYVGGSARRKPYPAARKWASQLSEGIRGGKFAEAKSSWLDGMDLVNANNTALTWAREVNTLVCSHGEFRFPILLLTCGSY